MSTVPGDIAVIASAVRGAGSRGARNLVSVAVLAFAVGAACLRRAWPLEPAWPAAYVVVVAAFFWLLFTLVGAGVARGAALAAGGAPQTGRALFSAGLRRARGALGLHVVVFFCAAMLAGAAVGLLQVVRVPWAGWPLAALLSPAILLLLGGAATIALGLLVCSHLAGCAVAIDDDGAYAGLSRGLAYLRARPFRVLLLRAAGLPLALFFAAPRVLAGAGAVAAAYGFARLTAPAATEKLIAGLGDIPSGSSGEAYLAALSVLVVLLVVAARLAAGPVAMLFGARVGQYLVLRRRIDGVPADSLPVEKPREKTLAEQGVELVERLRRDEGSVPS